MALIKSAWEIAMEKTKDIQADEGKIAHDERVASGRKLAANFLNDYQQTTDDLKKAYGDIPKAEKKDYIEGILAVVMDNLSLPTSKEYKSSFERVKQLASTLDNPMLMKGIEQIGQFFDQYLQQEDAITEQAKAQYEPRLRQKEAQLRQQYGSDITLRPEQDPDFLKMLDGALKKLDAQFDEALASFKAQMRSLFQNQ